MVDVFGDSGDNISVHALLDSGSSINLVSERLARMLGVPISRRKSPIGGIGNLVTDMSGVCLLKVRSRVSTDTYHVYASTISRIESAIEPSTCKSQLQ